ncbi:MAG: HIT domain-containing protein [Halieaceae bacterium]|jgi:diadenosine tetraphosphate (Ap4A) HIT family hydrolase|nr:HIT domain-containing protein [Halieaceae bacterium]
MERSQIHPQLLADCHYLGSLSASAVLLNRNAALPWFILVPDTRMADLLDLPEHHRDRVIADCAAVSGFIKQVLGYAKVNFAGLGNVVPQMHLHIIGRAEGDPCWPQPVWGNLPPGRQYESPELLGWQADLQKMVDLVPVDL